MSNKRHLTRRQRFRIDKIQSERTQRAQRKQEQAQLALEGGELGAEQNGRVIAHFGQALDIEAADGQVVRCHLRANLPTLVTGDKVIWRENATDSGVVVACEPRQSELCRPDNTGRLRPIAANIDQLLIVFAPLPTPHANLLDRYLIAAEQAGIAPLLLLNKADLPEALRLAPLLALYQELGYPLLKLSAHSGEGIQALAERLHGKASVFVGQSGVGKSSLVNRLLPEAQRAIGELSGAAGKGTHKTSSARLFHLPSGGDLIDSPGIREFGLTHVSRAEVEAGFIEFRPLLGHCRFRDCKHQTEPGCALLAALAEGHISEQRMHSYRQIVAGLPE